MHRSESCCRADCLRPSVTSLAAERFCFDHFFERCYQLLERIDARTRAGAPLSSSPEQNCAVNECAQRVLELSLRSTVLSNLERARLLDILLWSGDLTTRLRRKAAPDSRRSLAPMCFGPRPGPSRMAEPET